jgi:hypothetical protein
VPDADSLDRLYAHPDCFKTWIAMSQPRERTTEYGARWRLRAIGTAVGAVVAALLSRSTQGQSTKKKG